MISNNFFLMCILVINLTTSPVSIYFCNFTYDKEVSLIFSKDFNYVEVYDPIFNKIVKNVKEYTFIPKVFYKIKLMKFHSNNIFFAEDINYNFIKVLDIKILVKKGWAFFKIGSYYCFFNSSFFVILFLLILFTLLVFIRLRFLLILLLLFSLSFSQNYLIIENNTLRFFGKLKIFYNVLNVTPIEIYVQKLDKYERFIVINNLPRKICLSMVCYRGIIEETTPINLEYFRDRNILCVDKSSVGFLRVKFSRELNCYFTNRSVNLKIGLNKNVSKNVGFLLDVSKLKLISTNNSRDFLVSVIDYTSNLISLVEDRKVKFFDTTKSIDMYRFKLKYDVIFFKKALNGEFQIDIYPTNIPLREIYIFYPKIAWDGSLVYMIINDGNRTIKFGDIIINPGEIKTKNLVFKNKFLGEENVVFLLNILGKVYIMPSGFYLLNFNNKIVGNCYEIKNKTLCVLSTYEKRIVKVINSTSLKVIFKDLVYISNRSSFFVFFYPFKREFLFSFDLTDVFVIYLPIVFLIMILFYYNFLESELIRR